MHPNLPRTNKVGDSHNQDTSSSTTPPVPAQILSPRKSIWLRLTDKVRKRGVKDVTREHKHYLALRSLAKSVETEIGSDAETSSNKDQKPLPASAYTDVTNRHLSVTYHEETDFKCNFEVSILSPSVFTSLRQALNISSSSYLLSISLPPKKNFLEFFSNSNSGQKFFLTHDKRFMLKTEKKKYIRIFLNMLGDYVNHFIIYPHSLLIKILGVYCISLPSAEPIYFYVMQNIFHPDERIEEKYDLKGCTNFKRYEMPPVSLPESLAVFKDQNLLERNTNIHLDDTTRNWFLEQIRADSDFLRELCIMDYSLLLAVQPRQDGEKGRGTMGELAIRMRQSMTTAPIDISHSDFNTRRSSSDYGKRGRASVESRRASSSTDNYNISPPMFSLLALSENGVDSLNRRLLPKAKNPLHTIDGPEYRYYIGIIDIFTEYRCWQRMSRVLKTLGFRGHNHSSLPPGRYAERFYRFIRDRCDTR